MKKTQPSLTNNLPTLDLLTVQLAASVAGGDTGAVIDVTKANEAMQATSTNETSTIPGGYGSRPPFS